MVARDEVRILRATLHHAARHGLGSRDRAGRPDFAADRGRAGSLGTIDPFRAPAVRAALER